MPGAGRREGGRRERSIRRRGHSRMKGFASEVNPPIVTVSR